MNNLKYIALRDVKGKVTFVACVSYSPLSLLLNLMQQLAKIATVFITEIALIKKMWFV
jgi:hypothetical protein